MQLGSTPEIAEVPKKQGCRHWVLIVDKVKAELQRASITGSVDLDELSCARRYPNERLVGTMYSVIKIGFTMLKFIKGAIIRAK